MKWNNDYLLRVIAGEYVLVPVAGEAAKSSQIIAINPTAGEICTRILQGMSPEEIVDSLLRMYDTDRTTVTEDVTQTLRHLKQLCAVLD